MRVACLTYIIPNNALYIPSRHLNKAISTLVKGHKRVTMKEKEIFDQCLLGFEIVTSDILYHHIIVTYYSDLI